VLHSQSNKWLLKLVEELRDGLAGVARGKDGISNDSAQDSHPATAIGILMARVMASVRVEMRVVP
jgi:hypothetical protein